MSRNSIEELDFDIFAKDMIDLLEPLDEERGQRLERSITAVKVVGHRQILAQALGNLLENIVKYAPLSSALKLAVRPGSYDTGPEIIVEDRGPGIPAHACEQAVKTFVRLEHPWRQPDSGLGIAIAAAVARMHRDKLIIESAEPGLRVRLQLGMEQPDLPQGATLGRCAGPALRLRHREDLLPGCYRRAPEPPALRWRAPSLTRLHVVRRRDHRHLCCRGKKARRRARAPAPTNRGPCR
ncbi:MAG: sensor histidine kinase [Gammaproteobacteria bacterium]|nr:sensor histidine kinase [Gammaproteobacteria bacterium]